MKTSKPIIFDGVVPAILSPDTASAGVGIIAISDPTVLTGSGIYYTGSTSASTGTVSTGSIYDPITASTGTVSTGTTGDTSTGGSSTGGSSTGDSSTGDSSTGGGENKKNYTTYIIIALAVALTASISYMIYKSVKK